MNLGEHIYRLRTERNLSQGDLADALEVSRQSVSKWENNSAVPELDKLIRLAQIFGITIDELVTGTAEVPHESKEETVEPTAPPTQTHAVEQSSNGKNGLSAQQILGIVLMSFAGLCMIVFTVVGIFVGLWLLGIFIGIPFLLCGVICLLCKKNVGLKCAWIIYSCFWILVTVFITR